MADHDHFNNSNDDSFEKSLHEIRMYQSGPVDSKIRGIDPCNPIAMISNFPPIDELQDGGIVGDPIFNSTMLSDPVSAVTVPEPSPVEQINNSYQLNPEELVTRLNSSHPSVPTPSTETVTLLDNGSGIPLHTRNCDCSQSESGPCVSLDSFTGNVKIVTQKVLLNKGTLSVNKKKLQKLQEDIFLQQLKFEKVEDNNSEVSSNNSKLEDTLKTLEKQSQDHRDNIKDLTLKHNNLLEDYDNCKRMLDEAQRFQICAEGGAQQIATALQQAFDEQLAFSKLQKDEINGLTKRINKFTNERSSFLKLSEERMKKFNDKAELDIERVVKAHEGTIVTAQRQKGQIDELEKELDEAYDENEKLQEELGCEPDEVADMSPEEYKSNVSRLQDTSRALQARVRDLVVVNRELVEQNLNLALLTGNNSRTSPSTAGLPKRRTDLNQKMYTSRNVSFSGIDSIKSNTDPILNKTC